MTVKGKPVLVRGEALNPGAGTGAGGAGLPSVRPSAELCPGGCGSSAERNSGFHLRPVPDGEKRTGAEKRCKGFPSADVYSAPEPQAMPVRACFAVTLVPRKPNSGLSMGKEFFLSPGPSIRRLSNLLPERSSGRSPPPLPTSSPPEPA